MTAAEYGSAKGVEDDKLDVVLASALTMFAANGYDAATMRQISQRAKLSLAGVYHHYPAKYTMLSVLIQQFTKALTVGLERAAAPKPDIHPIKQLNSTVRYLVEYNSRQREIVIVGLREWRSLRSEHLDAYVAGMQFARKFVKSVLDTIAASNAYRVPTADISRLCFLLCLDAGQWDEFRNRNENARVADITERLVRLVKGL